MGIDAITTRADLIERIRDAYDTYSAAIESIPQDTLTAPGTCGAWSVRDVIAHVGGDEQWMAGQLEALLPAELPTAQSCYGNDEPAPDGSFLSQDGRNAWQRERLRNLSLDDTRAMAREAHARLLAVVSSLDDAQLSEPLAIAMLGTVGWVRPPNEGEQAYPLWEWLRGVTYKHYDEHTEMIRGATRKAQPVESD